MPLVLEADRCQLENAASLDKDPRVGVHQDVVDRRILQQRLERAEAGHLVDDVGDDPVLLLLIELHPLGAHHFLDQLPDLVAEFLDRELLDRREIDLVEQPLMQPHLDVGKFVSRFRLGWRRGHDGHQSLLRRIRLVQRRLDRSRLRLRLGKSAQHGSIPQDRAGGRSARPAPAAGAGGASLATSWSTIFVTCFSIALPGLTSLKVCPWSRAFDTRVGSSGMRKSAFRPRASCAEDSCTPLPQKRRRYRLTIRLMVSAATTSAVSLSLMALACCT